MKRARLLLVEDDAAIRRFVTLALEEMPLDIVEAPTLAAAIEALHGTPFQVVLCDLMLPDGSGLDLLRGLAGADSPCPGAARVAFSAGVSAAVSRELNRAGVLEILAKPASLAALESCVLRALAASTLSGASSAAPPVATHSAVAEFFGGDLALFQAFWAQCRPQFLHDAATGDQAVQHADLAALRRVAHSLKTLLLMLGEPADSLLAARVESAAGAELANAAALWPPLAVRLRQLARHSSE